MKECIGKVEGKKCFLHNECAQGLFCSDFTCQEAIKNIDVCKFFFQNPNCLQTCNKNKKC
jgi:hypothetical protein